MKMYTANIMVPEKSHGLYVWRSDTFTPRDFLGIKKCDRVSLSVRGAGGESCRMRWRSGKLPASSQPYQGYCALVRSPRKWYRYE